MSIHVRYIWLKILIFYPLKESVDFVVIFVLIKILRKLNFLSFRN